MLPFPGGRTSNQAWKGRKGDGSRAYWIATQANTTRARYAATAKMARSIRHTSVHSGTCGAPLVGAGAVTSMVDARFTPPWGGKEGNHAATARMRLRRTPGPIRHCFGIGGGPPAKAKSAGCVTYPLAVAVAHASEVVAFDRWPVAMCLSALTSARAAAAKRFRPIVRDFRDTGAPARNAATVMPAPYSARR